MSEAFSQGVIDFINGPNIRGWFRLQHQDRFDLVLMLGDTRCPVTVEPATDKSLQWKFHASSPEPLMAGDFLTGHAVLRLTVGDAIFNLPLWEPLRASASVERLNDQTVPRFLYALSARQRAVLRAQIEAIDGQKPVQEKPDRRKRALFGNAEFAVVAGSELVITEMVEELSALGWSCDITAWSFAQPMRDIARKAGARLLDSPIDIRAFEYDLVWLHNRLEPVFDYSLSPGDAEKTLFIFPHLDRSWSYAQPGVVLEPLLGDAFLTTEVTGIDRLLEYGLAEKSIRLFRNPAPKAFELPAAPSRGLKRLLVVSNHPPAEVMETGQLLRARGVEVSWWGSGGDVRERRLLPADLADADAVLTIGKTVPYALRAQRPVFVYDHFGGPGWLRQENFGTAAARNFSGLCCERRLAAAELCEEILVGFEEARRAAATFGDEMLAPYRLEDEVARLLALQANASTPAEHRARLDRHAAAWRRERQLALTAGTYFRNAMTAHRKAESERTKVSSTPH